MSEASHEVLIVVVYGTLILLIAVVVLISFFFMYQRRQQTNLQEKLRLHDQYEREILKTQLEVQEQTHQQISREIHDNVGQVLVVVRMYLRGLQESCDENVQARIQETDQLVGGAIDDLRNLAHSMSSEQLKNNGLASVLKSEVEHITNSGQLEMTLHVTGEGAQADHEIKLILFRMWQELLSNIIKHSKATHADVVLKETEESIQITVKDNGIGFTPGKNNGNGLFNIYRRAELIGAKVALESEPGKGTAATVTWSRNNVTQ